jgi:uncharacterized C2H2 Zn-finger protein
MSIAANGLTGVDEIAPSDNVADTVNPALGNRTPRQYLRRQTRFTLERIEREQRVAFRSGDSIRKCGRCERICVGLVALKLHLAYRHGSYGNNTLRQSIPLQSDQRFHICARCGEEFENRGEWLRHWAAFHPGSSFGASLQEDSGREE